MKLLSYRHRGSTSYGIVVNDGIIDAGKRLGKTCPALRSILAADKLPELAQIAQSEAADLPLNEIEFLPVIPDAGKIVAVGRNYADHVAEGKRVPPRYPMLFPRYSESVVAHQAKLVKPNVSDEYDYEGELAVIIGRGGRHISTETALQHVAGYSCFNDGSVRDWQRHTAQLLPGKNFSRSGAIGPWLVTSDEIGDPAALELKTRVNGEQVQSSRTDQMIFSIPFLINYISTFIELVPGDVIATGTPSGVGLYRTPQLFLKPGYTVEVEISGIGILRNEVIAET